MKKVLCICVAIVALSFFSISPCTGDEPKDQEAKKEQAVTEEKIKAPTMAPWNLRITQIDDKKIPDIKAGKQEDQKETVQE